jgi:hypothetical protein
MFQMIKRLFFDEKPPVMYKLTFRSTYPDERLSYNEISVNIFNQLNKQYGTIRISKKGVLRYQPRIRQDRKKRTSGE